MFDVDRCPVKIGDRVEFLNRQQLAGKPPGDLVLEVASRHPAAGPCPHCGGHDVAVFGYANTHSYAVCGCSIRVIT